MTLTEAEVLEILAGISPQEHKPGPSRVRTSSESTAMPWNMHGCFDFGLFHGYHFVAFFN